MLLSACVALVSIIHFPSLCGLKLLYCVDAPVYLSILLEVNIWAVSSWVIVDRDAVSMPAQGFLLVCVLMS